MESFTLSRLIPSYRLVLVQVDETLIMSQWLGGLERMN